MALKSDDVLATTGIAVLVVNQSSQIEFSNPAAAVLFGYGTDALAGLPITKVLPDGLPSAKGAKAKAAGAGRVLREATGCRRDGSMVLLALQVTPWADDAGERHSTVILRDVSEEVAAARKAREDLRLSDNAIRGAKIGVFEYDPVKDDVVVTEIWRELVELDPDDPVDVQVAWRARVHPDDLPIALEPVRLCVEEGQERAVCEYRLNSKNRAKWRWIRTDVAVARRDETGKVVRVIGAMTDITERKMIEDALRKSMDQFRSAFELGPIGKAIVGLDGAWLRVNPALCRLFGYSEDELMGMTFQSLTHPDDLSRDVEELMKFRRGEITHYQTEKRYLRADGSVIWGLMNVGLVRDSEGTPDHLIAQIVDITEQRRLADLQSEFVATVSHELRTPLTSVLGALKLLSSLDQDGFSDEAQRLIYIAQRNGDRLHQLVNDILDFEKYSGQAGRAATSRQNMVALVEDAVMAALPQAERFEVRYNVRCADRAIEARVDPKRIHQVLSNLLSNAAKFADKGTEVDVLVERTGGGVKVSVTNLGPGIPEDFRDLVFRPFTQAEPTSTRRRSGSGLGLSISKKIVEAAGGQIGFESSREAGTTFWFSLPA